MTDENKIPEKKWKEEGKKIKKSQKLIKRKKMYESKRERERELELELESFNTQG